MTNDTTSIQLPRSRDELREAVDAGAAFEYLCFWGHRPRPDGSIGSTCLSQFFVAPFEVDGQRYPTAEHWMMKGVCVAGRRGRVASAAGLDARHP